MPLLIIGIVVSAVVSIGLDLLARALAPKPEQQDFNESLPDSSYRRNIPRPYNFYRYDVNWIEPYGEEEAFSKERRGSGSDRRDVLYGRFLGAVCNNQADLIAIWVNGKGRANELHTDQSALQAGRSFINNNVTWLNGSYEQQGWSESKLAIANKPYRDQVGASYNNQAVGYRGISCIGFRKLDLSEDVKTSTFPNVSCLVKTHQLYDLPAILLDICKDAGVEASEIDTTEITGIAVKGSSRPQSGANYDETIADLIASYRFFITETNEGKLICRKFERPSSPQAIPWYDLIPYEDGRLWQENKADPLELPKTISVSFVDPALEYTSNTVISDEYPEALYQNEDSIDLPVVLSESEAKELANWHLNQTWIRAAKYQYKLSLKYLGQFLIGDTFTLPDGTVTQVSKYTIGAEDYIIEIEAVRYDTKSITTTATVNNQAPVVVPPVTNTVDPQNYNPNGTIKYGDLQILDIPLAAQSHSELVVYCFSDRAHSTLYLQNDTTYEEELTFVEASTFGSCNTILASVPNTNLQSTNLPLADSTNTLEITLTSGKLPEEITDSQFTSQLQIAFVGRYNGTKWVGEFIGFQFADALTSGRYRLQNFQRGLKGTEYYISQHQTGEKFFLLTGKTAYWERLILEESQIGDSFSAKLKVANTQDLAVTPTVNFTFHGQSIYSYPPVNVVVKEDPENNLVFSFTSRSRGTDKILGESQNLFELDILNNSGSVIRTLSGGNPLVYPQAQKTIDSIDLTAINGNLYKLNSLTGRGYQSLIRNLASSGTSNTVVTSPNSQIKGFKYISTDYTVSAADDDYWLLVSNNITNINITFPDNLTSIKLRVQNIGSKKVNLLGNLTAVDTVLRPKEAIYLANRTIGWYGHLSGRIEIPQHLIVSTNFSLANAHHSKIVAVDSPNIVIVTLDETLLTNPQDFHTTIRKKGSGNVFFELANPSTSTLEAVGTTITTQYRAVYVGYEGDGVWVAIGDLV
ncbi:MAG: phage tail protein [Waterburya sp.]